MCVRWLISISLVIGMVRSPAQTGPATYRVQFRDKASTPYTLEAPEAYLSPRALERRARQGIAIDSLDLPIDPALIATLMAVGDFELVNRQKWFNSVTIRTTDTLALDTLALLPFVLDVKMLSDGRPRPARAEKFNTLEERQEIGGYYNSIYGASFRQIEMMNGHLLHQAGAHGEGMLLGILDAGFLHADSLPAFAALRARNGIVLTRDLAYNDGDVYHDHWHGRSVLSCIAGQLPGQLLGTAPAVNVALLRTEVAESEFPWEEDNWVSGAELADSLGCDILNSSLGYTQFDDSTMDHTYADLDGVTLRISLAAGIASRKGMIPVNSAGNSGNSTWYHIGAPADAIDILAVGAVGEDRQRAPFSSYGPSADERVKPDVSAVGYHTVGLGADGTLSRINGTSFSSPLLAGSTACLWQLHPEATAQRIMAAIRASASQHDSPDASLGYGIPDLWRAHLLLGGTDLTGLHASELFDVWPLPFSDHFEVTLFTGASDHVNIQLHDASGRQVWEATDELDRGTYVRLRVGDAALARLVPGMYVLRATTGSAEMTRQVMKIAP